MGEPMIKHRNVYNQITINAHSADDFSYELRAKKQELQFINDVIVF